MTRRSSIYDYPLYYEILFGWDRDLEADFYDAALRHYGAPASGRIAEIGCGPGQIGVRLARRGWGVIGLDLSRGMLDLFEQRATEAGVKVETACADMASFDLGVPLDGAYCPLSSFRMLDDASARLHLRATAAALKPGGVYILDLSFEAPGEDQGEEMDQWVMRRGPIEVAARLEGIEVMDDARGTSLALEWGPELRPYTVAAFAALVEESGPLALESCHPEVGQTEDEISYFEIERTIPSPVPGRSMVVLRRA